MSRGLFTPVATCHTQPIECTTSPNPGIRVYCIEAQQVSAARGSTSHLAWAGGDWVSGYVAVMSQ